MSVPKPTCCEKAPYVVFFDTDTLGTWEGPGWYVLCTEFARREAFQKDETILKGAYPATHCPFCGSDLPEVRPMEDPPQPLCVPEESHCYCETCNERLIACNCHRPEESWEIVP